VTDAKILNRGAAALAAAVVATTGGVFTAVAQVKTNLPDPIPDARLAIVERIKIHGKALEGNLEGDAVDREVIDQYGIANAFEVYPGTHTSDVAVRFQEHVMPFFSRTLSFEPAR